MSSLTWIPFWVLFKREVHRFLKVIFQTVVTPLITASLYLLIFGLSLNIEVENVSYLAFLIPGLMMMGCLNNSFQNVSSSIVSSKFSGELEDYKVSVLSHQQIIWAMSFGGVIRGLVVAGVTFLVGQFFYYHSFGSFLSIHSPLLLFFFLVVGGLSFAKMGLSVAILAKNFDHMSAFGIFVITPLIYLGGVFYSLDKLPVFWQSISKANPLLYFINGVRYGVLGVSDVDISSAVVVSLLSLLFFHLAGLFCFKKGSFVRW